MVDEIETKGGTAVANGSDVSTPEGGEEIVAAALDAFGQIDAIVANAGIIRYAELPEIDVTNVQDHFDVHLLGTFNVVRAAWPRFVEQGFGRIVTTTSAGIFGLGPNLSYAVAKSGTIGLTRNLAIVGAEHGIKANLIAPNAWTRMAGQSGTSG
ncbi:MAG: SDR family oxidoreductase, partial [Pseudonocardia sp.]|nr:SDR family oxidoreductase [Pseudonocardia sp.]